MQKALDLAKTSPLLQAVVGLIALLMMAVPVIIVVRSDASAVSRAEREATGLAADAGVLRIIQLTERHRGLSNLVLGDRNDEEASDHAARHDIGLEIRRTAKSLAELGDAPITHKFDALSQKWATLSTDVARQSISAADSFRRHTVLVDGQLQLADDISESSGITSDPEPSSHFIALAAIQDLPRSAEQLARIRGEGALLLARGTASTADRTRLIAEAQTARDELQQAHDAIWSAIPALGTARNQLPSALRSVEAASARALEFTDRVIVGTKTLKFPPTSYFATMTRAIDAQFGLMNASLGILRDQLRQRTVMAWTRLIVVIGSMGVLSLIGAWLIYLISRARQAERSSYLRIRAVLDAAPYGLLIVDTARVVVQANRAAERMYESTAGGLTGVRLNELFSEEDRESVDRDPGLTESADVPITGLHDRDLHGVRADGKSFPVELTRSTVETENGKWTINVVRDLTYWRQLEQQVRQSQKMDAIGQLTGGIAHDFNNLLGVIIGNLDLLERVISENPVAVARVASAMKAALRGSDLTRRLLAFSRRQHLDAAPLRIESAIENVIEMAKRTLGPEISISSDIEDDTLTIVADPSALESALLNLAVNARDAMPRGGAITFSAAAAELDERHPLVRARELAPGRYAQVRVSDTGDGIAAESLHKVFEPFYTTKKPGEGTGLGLPMVYGFAKQSGGTAKIYSEVGVGTTVCLLLPLAQDECRAVPLSATSNIQYRAPRGATALLVDDEADLREVAAAYLEEMGYRVVTAGDGPSALDTLASEPRIDLLVTDVIMPGGMNGVGLARRVREQRPETRIVFTSGFPSQALAQRSGTRVDGPLISKPFLRREFVNVIGRAMLGEAA